MWSGSRTSPGFEQLDSPSRFPSGFMSRASFARYSGGAAPESHRLPFSSPAKLFLTTLRLASVILARKCDVEAGLQVGAHIFVVRPIAVSY